MTRPHRSPRHAVTGLVAGVLLAGLVVPLASGDDQEPVGAGATAVAPAAGTHGNEDADSAVAGSTEHAMSPGADSTSGSASVDALPSGASGATASSIVEGQGAVRGVDWDAGTIKVGVFIIDIAQGAAIGFAVPNLSVDDIRRMYEAFIADINERGGINGLTVEPVYATHTNAASERAMCLELTEDTEVFMVTGTGPVTSSTILCFTEEHGQLTITSGTFGIQGSIYDRSGDLLFTSQATGQRIVRDGATALNDRALFDGATVGLIGDEATDPGGEVLDALEQRLQQLGVEVTYRSTFSADTDAATSQAPVEVAQHRQKGVDTVVMAARVVDVGTAFVQAAESSGWRPTYLATDWASYFCDTCVQLMPPSFEGARLITHMPSPLKNASQPETEVGARCREAYERQTGETINYAGIGLEGDAYNVMMMACGQMAMFERGATAAVPSLAYPPFARALEAAGDWWIPPTGPGRFGPGKHDNSDTMLEAVFTYDCKCWRARSTAFEFGPYG